MDSHRLILITVSGIYKLHDMVCVIPFEQRRRGNSTHSSGSSLHVSGEGIGEPVRAGTDLCIYTFLNMRQILLIYLFIWLCWHVGSFFSVVVCELLLLGGSAVKKNPPVMQAIRKHRFDP